MSILRTIRTRWSDLSGAAVPGDDVRQRGEISSGDQFIFDLSAPISNFQKAQAASLPSPRESLSSIAVRFIGFEKRFKSLIAPLERLDIKKTSEIRGYFVGSLGATVELARMRPKTAHQLIASKATGGQDLYRCLVGIACGDTSSILPAMDAIAGCGGLDESLAFECLREVGKYRPYEAGHLLMKLFGRASTKLQLAIMSEFVSSPVIGDKQAVGDLFVALLERSTEEEKRDEIYPALLSTIHSVTSLHHTVQVKRGFLAALLRGSMSQA